MSQEVRVEIIHPNEWQRLRAIRLKSLRVNPEAFGGTYEIESQEDEAAWREKFVKLDFLIASVGGVDAAMAAYEKLGFVKMGEDTPSTRQPGKFHQRMIRNSAD